LEFPLAIRQILAFTKRDFSSWTTYRTTVITQLINVFIGVFSWGVSATYVQRPVNISIGNVVYTTDYISFLVVGVAVGNLIMPLVQGINSSLNPWTLETVLMTGISTPVFVIGNIAWTYLFSIITFVPYLLIGISVFHVSLNVNIVTTVVAFAISAVILMGLAMISTGLRIVTKSTDPVTWAISVLQNLFSGALFPTLYLDTIFFPGVSMISWFLPQTWVYLLCRAGMLCNASLLDPQVLTIFLGGCAFAAVLFPIGFKIFSWGVARSKKEGTLGWY
jgi:hypothetical protein